MAKHPLVSVIIPCYNAAQYVGEAVTSALNQTYSNVEVIVVDDGSSDQSIEVIQSFGDRIRLERTKHQGACAARNRGLQLSQGEFIQFLDADDVLLPEKIERQIPILQSDQADLVFCNGYLFGDDRPQRPIKKLLALPSPVGQDPFLYCLRHGFGTEGPLHKRRFLEKVGGFREELPGAQEFDLHIRLSAVGARLIKLDDFLFKHRNHDDSARITRKPKPPGYMAWVCMGLADQLLATHPDTLTQDRRMALAGAIFQHAIYAYRGGNKKLAKEGFVYAKKLSQKFDYSERSWYKTLAQWLPPSFLEASLQQARSSRDYFKRMI
jgi:glycosyltransferase involved in cell wall biosynthesis